MVLSLASSVLFLPQERDARIIIGLMYEDMFRKAMCTVGMRLLLTTPANTSPPFMLI